MVEDWDIDLSALGPDSFSLRSLNLSGNAIRSGWYQRLQCIEF